MNILSNGPFCKKFFTTTGLISLVSHEPCPSNFLYSQLITGFKTKYEAYILVVVAKINILLATTNQNS